MIANTGDTSFNLIAAEAHTVMPSFEEAVREGLDRPQGQRRIPCRFLYDERGSQLFEQICELPEYYPTRTEVSILETNAAEIVEPVDEDSPLVELGSGSERKIRPILQALIERRGRAHYIPIDISPTILEENASKLLKEFGDSLTVTAIAGEYRDALQALESMELPRPLGLWLGGSIGNMERSTAAEFLRGLRSALPQIVIGIDLRKASSVLVPAYDDPSGVTAEFSLNLLRRISRELDANFELDRFRHVADYDSDSGKVEIELESLAKQSVKIAGLDLVVEFDKGERIHIEDSTKYSPDEIKALAAASGFKIDKQWLDPNQRFSVTRFASD